MKHLQPLVKDGSIHGFYVDIRVPRECRDQLRKAKLTMQIPTKDQAVAEAVAAPIIASFLKQIEEAKGPLAHRIIFEAKASVTAPDMDALKARIELVLGDEFAAMLKFKTQIVKTTRDYNLERKPRRTPRRTVR